MAALVCALVFALTSWCWTYLANVVVSFPFGLAAFVLWRRIRRGSPASLLVKATGWLLAFGVVSALGALLLYK